MSVNFSLASRKIVALETPEDRAALGHNLCKGLTRWEKIGKDGGGKMCEMPLWHEPDLRAGSDSH